MFAGMYRRRRIVNQRRVKEEAMDKNRYRVLVTGGSGGIGLALAEEFARRGHSLLLVARSREKLEEEAARLAETYSIAADVFPADLTEPANRGKLAEAAAAPDNPIDVLVNNAGFATYGLFYELKPEQEMAMIRLNVEALVDLSARLLPGMVERGRGGILNVSSTAAFQPGPLMASYYASKAFVLSHSEALANEVGGTGVSVTALCPGPTESNFQRDAGLEDSKLVQAGLMDAETVARAGVKGFLAGKRVVIPGFKNRFGAFMAWLMPRSFVTKVVRNLQSS
jgi:hypothetical protein